MSGLLKLIDSGNGLKWYGADLISLPATVSLTNVHIVLKNEDYLCQRRLGDGEYRFLPKDAKHNIAHVRLPDIQNNINGTIEFLYTSPEGKIEIKDKIQRIAKSLNGHYRGLVTNYKDLEAKWQ